MSRDPVLNPARAGAPPAAVAGDALELSRELLHAARTLGEPGDALATVERLAASLRAAPLDSLATDAERTAFWLNVYNALSRHALAAEGARGNLLLKLGLFARSAYLVGGARYSLDVIEHGLLRGNRRPPTGLRRTLSDGDPRLARAPRAFDPRIHFALNCGARSCPPIRSYTAAGLERELDLATRSYVGAETAIDRDARRVALPRLLKYYGDDFGDERARVRFCARHLDDDDRAWLEAHAARVDVTYGAYDWTIAH